MVNSGSGGKREFSTGDTGISDQMPTPPETPEPSPGPFEPNPAYPTGPEPLPYEPAPENPEGPEPLPYEPMPENPEIPGKSSLD